MQQFSSVAPTSCISTTWDSTWELVRNTKDHTTPDPQSQAAMPMPMQDGEQLALRWVGCETPAQARSSHPCCLPARAGPQHPHQDWKGFGSLSRVREV